MHVSPTTRLLGWLAGLILLAGLLLWATIRFAPAFFGFVAVLVGIVAIVLIGVAIRAAVRRPREIPEARSGTPSATPAGEKRQLKSASVEWLVYVKEDAVRQRYSAVEKEQVIGRARVQDIKGSGDAEVTVPGAAKVSGGVELGDNLTTVSVPSEVSLSTKLEIVVSALLNNNKMILGLETNDIAESRISDFRQAIAELEAKFAFRVRDADVEEHLALLRVDAAEPTLSRLRKAQNMPLLLKGEFAIDKDAVDTISFTYHHPITEYLRDKHRVLIRATAEVAKLEDDARVRYSTGTGHKARLYLFGVGEEFGEDENERDWILTVSPIAIYRGSVSG